MKRIIILLLVLSCFRFSYAQELTAEQQQLAWKFIYDMALLKSTDFHPTVFKDDIIINLKGKVTTEDSMVVKDIIKNFQKAIPHLKISLSNSPGNLILGLDFNKMHSITSNFNMLEAQSRKVQFSLPDNLTSFQRKQVIYHWLYKGLVSFNYNNSSVNILGMNGCVFCENDFDSITFSPFDLFILEKLYSPDFFIQLAKNYPIELQVTAWNAIRTRFLGDTKKPIIYRTDIGIKLEGNVSSADSACMNKLIDELKLIIPTRKIFLTKENANVVFKLLSSNSGTVSHSTRFGTSLQLKNFHFHLAPDFTEEARRRTLYFCLYNALVDLSSSKFEYTGVPYCVFDEETPHIIKIQPLDAFILGKLYADDFQEQFKSQYLKQFSYREYLVFIYHNELDLFFQFLGFLFSIILFTALILKGAFKDHQWNWIAFNKQGMFLILLAILYPFCISLSDLKFAINDYAPIIDEVLSLFLVVNLIYLAERMILKDRNLGGSKIIVIFLTTLILTVVVSIMFGLKANPLGYFGFFPISDSLFPRILVASLARCLYVFLNDRYKSIINQKDVELAQMGEFQKQAELQSLRAKINPHFLYNALNSIASLATTDARKTEQMALALSDFFKYAINREQKQLNTLSEELNAIRTYLEIEKVRFGDRLSFDIDCPTELLNIQIPQLLIQPLVENAIKHGLSQITENGLIRILVNRAENQLKIRVYDNGPVFPDGPLSGFGIQNTQERIVLLYGAKAKINWQNGVEKYIEISISD